MLTYKSCCLELLWEKMRKLAKQLQIDVNNFSEMKKTKNERRFYVTLGYSITVRDVIVLETGKQNLILNPFLYKQQQ